MFDEENTVHFFSKEPTLIGKVLKELLEKQGLSEGVTIYLMVEKFCDFFPELAPFCEAFRFVEGTLYLRVKDPTYVLEVRSREGDIKERFRKEGMVVNKLKIVCG